MRHQFCIIFFFLCTVSATAQKAVVQNLVFEGAGMRGIAYAGAIAEMEKRNLLPQVKRVGGTSAGAITALMIALGYGADEITEIIGNTNFKKFNDGKYFFAGGASRTARYFGWYRGRRFQQWLADIIIAKAGHANLTFEQLRQKGFKDLYITGTSLNEQQLLVFSHENYPHMKVADAVRISVSIPFYFEALFLDSNGKVVERPKNKDGLRVMVDGGFTGNFPIKMFDSTRYMDASATNGFSINPQTLGFRIDRDAQIESDANGKGLAHLPVTNIKEYATAFYNMIIENLNRQTLTAADWSRTVSISDGAVGPRIRKLSKSEIKVLIENGHKAAATYLNALQ